MSAWFDRCRKYTLTDAQTGFEINFAGMIFTDADLEKLAPLFAKANAGIAAIEKGEIKTVTIPSEFDKIFAAYNELQKEQGLNLTKYKGKDVTRYTFAVTNYKSYEGTVYANVLVYRNRVIAGDICSADVNGFVHGFEK